MSKSNRGGLTGRRSGGTVTVIEEPVRRSAVRKAKIVFWICWITIGLLAATVLASKWHPILALLAGVAIGLAAAAVIAALVIAWPVLRALWWWTPEIGLTLGLVTGWVDLADHTTLYIRLVAVVSIVGVPGGCPGPSGLDLPDVSAADVTPPPRPTPTLTRTDRKTPAPTPAPTGVDPDVADYL